MKVFVSSTTKDLGEARKKVCERLPQIDNQYDCMDCYTSDPRSPKQLDNDKVNSCEAFLIIVGHQYGSSPEGEDKSFTELEYEAAIAANKKVYPFLASDKFPVLPTSREDDATYNKLQAFRDRLAKNHAPRYFDNIDQLCTEVIAALSKPAPESGRITVPMIPRPYLAHPYPLQENFTGRLKELVMLTEWVRASDSKPMLSLVGMGGLGKSALTWFWLHEDLPQEKLTFSGIIWWSFYESTASFESFLSHALLYTSGGTIDPAQVPSDYDRMQSLWCILRDSPFLLIFDGAERLLRAYHTLDAAYKGDDFGEEAGDKHLQCANPQAGQFLQWLASPGVKTYTLLTTRLHPKELKDLAGCRKEDLDRLEPDDAVEFMRKQGIKGPRNAIVRACEPYDFLPLCLRLLSGAIREDPQMPNDIEAAKDWHPPEKLVRKEHHILQVAYDTMKKDRQELLSRIAAMRGPVDYATTKVLSTYEDENELKETLRELVARGLLFRREDQTYYDLHPIVRQYAYDRLGDKTATHKILKDYFDTVPTPDKIESLDDLTPTVELFHHTISSGRYEEAFRIYQDRLTDPLYYQLGAYDVDISLKRAFFPDGEDKQTQLKDELDQAWIFNDLAISYDKTGQSRKAVVLRKRSMTINSNQEKWHRYAIDLGNLAICQLLLGELKGTELSLMLRTKISKEIREKITEAEGLRQLGRLFTYIGRYDQAEKELEKAIGVFTKQKHYSGQCLAWSDRGLCGVLMNEPKLALKALKKAQASAEKWRLKKRRPEPNQWDFVRILWLSGTAKRLAGYTSSSEADLNDALSRCRRIRLVEFEADILLEIAKLQWQKAEDGKRKTEDRGLKEQAKSLTREALEIAGRCEYRLKRADIYNFLAGMAFAEDDKQNAREHAQKAYDYAYCDGPPYCYKKALDEAEQMLAKLK